MLYSSRNVFVIILKLNILEIILELVFTKNTYQNTKIFFMNQGVQKTLLAKTLPPHTWKGLAKTFTACLGTGSWLLKTIFWDRQKNCMKDFQIWFWGVMK